MFASNSAQAPIQAASAYSSYFGYAYEMIMRLELQMTMSGFL